MKSSLGASVSTLGSLNGSKTFPTDRSALNGCHRAEKTIPMLKRWTVLPAIHIMKPIIMRFLKGACATSHAFCPFQVASASLRCRAVAASSASGADLVKPGGSGKADEEEEEDASWSSTAQRRARPLPFSIAGGRCSNGRVVVDFLAEHFGLPLPPASQAHGTDFSKGANFAITGATALDYAFFKAHGIDQRIWNTGSIITQIGWLQKMKPSLCKSEKECRDFFSKSLFVVGEFGGNDYNAPLFSGVAFSDVKTYVPLVTKAIANGVEILIELGATDLLVPGILPIGCFPLYLTLYNSSKKSDYNARTGCLRRYNRLAFHHNRDLKQQLDELQKKYPKTKIMYGDYFKAAMQFVVSPKNFGFSTALQACCGASGEGSYNFNMKKKCGEAGASVCSNPASYVSWDGIHMTEAAYRMVANGWLNGPYASPPIMK